jgi:hypothetical protein
MQIDWVAAATIAGPILAVFFAIPIDRYFRDRPRLVVFISHASTFRVTNQQTGLVAALLPKNPDSFVNAHTVVLQNVGRKTATNISVGHNFLPNNYQIYPAIEHSLKQIPGTGNEIFIPRLSAKEQIIISYLYEPPLVVNQINTYVKSDDGLAKVIQVLPMQQFPRWVGRTVLGLATLGISFILIIAFQVISYLISHFH